MKKWVIGLIVVIFLLVIFFFPKSCGGGGGTGGPWSEIECSCIGFKGDSPWNFMIMDAVNINCYGICLKSTCIHKTLWGNAEIQCQKDSDCASTCGKGCVNSDWAKSYDDPCVNVRAYACSCNKSMCYTDGKQSTFGTLASRVSAGGGLSVREGYADVTLGREADGKKLISIDVVFINDSDSSVYTITENLPPEFESRSYLIKMPIEQAKDVKYYFNYEVELSQ